eukprot:1331153-Pyramimonas_sp.AAC.1
MDGSRHPKPKQLIFLVLSCLKVDEFKKKGVDKIMCVSVNDPFAMSAWAEKMGLDTSKPDCQPHGLRCSHFLLATCRLSFGQAKRELDARCPVVTQVSLYADVDGSWTRSLGMEKDLGVALLGQRSQRYAMYVDNGIIIKMVRSKQPTNNGSRGAKPCDKGV